MSCNSRGPSTLFCLSLHFCSFVCCSAIAVVVIDVATVVVSTARAVLTFLAAMSYSKSIMNDAYSGRFKL